MLKTEEEIVHIVYDCLHSIKSHEPKEILSLFSKKTQFSQEQLLTGNKMRRRDLKLIQGLTYILSQVGMKRAQIGALFGDESYQANTVYQRKVAFEQLIKKYAMEQAFQGVILSGKWEIAQDVTVHPFSSHSSQAICDLLQIALNDSDEFTKNILEESKVNKEYFFTNRTNPNLAFSRRVYFAGSMLEEGITCFDVANRWCPPLGYSTVANGAQKLFTHLAQEVPQDGAVLKAIYVGNRMQNKKYERRMKKRER